MLYVFHLVRVFDRLVFSPKSVAKHAGIKVCCILDTKIVANLVFNLVPVLFFQVFEHIFVVAPVDLFVTTFEFLGHFFILLQCVAFSVVLEGNSLRQLLEDLIPTRKLLVSCVKSHGWLVTLRGHYFNAAILFNSFVLVQTLDVLLRTQEFLFCGVEHRHQGDFRNSLLSKSSLEESF